MAEVTHTDDAAASDARISGAGQAREQAGETGSAAAPAAPDGQVREVVASGEGRRTRPSFIFFGGVAAVCLLADVSSKAWAEVALPAILHNQPFAPAATQLNTKLDAFINQEIKDLSAKGVKVSRADITFPDWNPLQAYQPGQK